MPGFKELRKGKYPNAALAYAVEKFYVNTMIILEQYVPEEELDQYKKEYMDYMDMSDLVFADDIIYSRNKSENVKKKMTDTKADEYGIRFLEKTKDYFTKARKAFPELDKDFKDFFDSLEIEGSSDGSLMEARFESQYLTNLNQLGGGPKFFKFSSAELKNGLLGEKDEATGKYKGPYEPLMDYYRSTTNLIKLEFVRQKNNEEGWTPEKEQEFLANLKKEQENVVDSFERLYAIEDNGQYDKYLDNELEHITGKKGQIRSAYKCIGAVKGQIKAIENGWSQDELTVLGSIGIMEAHLKMLKDEFEEKMAYAYTDIKLGENGIADLSDKDLILWGKARRAIQAETDNRKLIKEFEDELNKLKEAAWNKKIESDKDKEEITGSVSSFMKKYREIELKDFSMLGMLNGLAKEIKDNENFVKEVADKLVLAKNNINNNVNQNVINNNANINNVNQNVINNNANINNNAKPELYDVGVKRDSLPNEGYVEAFNDRKKKADTAIRAYSAQSSKEDKILFYLSYAAKNTVNQNQPIMNTTIEIPADIPELEKNAIKNKADEQFQSAMEIRKNAGINPIAGTSPEEDDCQENLKNKLIYDLVGDGSRENIIDSFKAFGIVNALNINNQGKKYKEILDSLPKNEPNRDKKALYLAYKRQGHEAMLNAAAGSFSSTDFIAVFNYSDDIGIEVKDKIFDNFKYDKDRTTFKDFFDKLGYTADERKLYMADNGCSEADKIYDYYKNKLTDDEVDNPTDADVLESVKEAYTTLFAKIIVNSVMKGPMDYFDANYSVNMTVSHYMNILRFKDEEKKDFLKYYGAKETDSVFNTFNKYINDNEVIKNRILDENEKNEMNREITADNVRNFAKQLLGEEFASKRKKLKTFENEYSENMTVARYMEILDLDDFAKNEFLSSYDTTENARIKDVFSKELSAEKGDNAVVSDEELNVYAGKKLGDAIEEQINSGKYIEDKTVWGNMYVHFADNIGTFGDKMIYKKGHIVNGGEGLVPKNNPKTESQKEFKKWTETTGKEMLENVYLEDQIDAFKKTTAVIYSKKAINIHNDDFVADYFDSAVPVSNTTFLRGAISALENTKTGKKWTNSTKDRSKNSEKYETMLKAIKEYHEKMVTDDRFDLVGARDDLKKACIAYITGKESLRKSDFGKERFDVAMTVLFDIMPRKEFLKIIRQVNGERSRNERISFDTYNVKYAELYSAEEAREEERQVNAEKKYLTHIPDDYIEKFDNVLNVFGLEPKAEGQLDDIFDDFNLTFTKVEDKLSPIGKGLKERSLSNEDFAAIAYAGTLSDAAIEYDSRYKDKDLKQYKLLATAKDYTVALARKHISPETGEYAEVIQAGRNAAVDAMKEYAKGDKFLLASILSSGIRHIAAMSRLSESIDEDYICNGEMGRRMIEMLDRDPQLKSMVINTSYQGINDDISYIDTINQAAKIFIDASAASEVLMNIAADPESYNLDGWDAKGKQELITDIMMLKVLDSSKEMYHKSVNEVLKTDSKYKIKMQQAVEKEIADIDEAISSDEVKEVRNKLIDAAASKKELRIKIMKDYIRNDKLLLALNTDKSVAALRESVKELVKENGFDKLGPEDILKKMNDRKLLAKLGNITKDANSKYSDEYSKRKEAEKKSRLEAQQKKQAARGH
ncbi:MAG: hypothetical protein IKQ71_02550 [Lachnospiraceae bacterium]|nr:hypothetical protein [Lachnospiraceae bacterium]